MPGYRWLSAAVLILLCGGIEPLVAQSWPTRPVTVVVPFVAGGGTDVPAHTPATVIQRLHDATVKAIDTPAVQEPLLESGALVVAPARRTTEYLERFVETEIEKHGAPIRAAGISIDSGNR
ncbi:MAG: hypothetical protein IT537_19180 [Hyphomicrobiales bacterium]|nr:hypothetical protein [Hyphomicrobiales bacterium]